MRIIIATSSYPARPDEAINAGVFVRDIAAELLALGHFVQVLTPGKGEPIVGSPVPVTTFNWGGSEKVLTRLDPRLPSNLVRLVRLMLGGQQALRELVNGTQAAVVLAMWAIPAGYWAQGLRCPYGVWALGSDIWKADQYPFGTLIVRRILQNARHLFADGLKLSKEVQRLCGRECTFLASGRHLPVGLEAAVSLPAGRPQFVFIGRWDRVKGVDILLDAMEIVRDQLPTTRLHLFGGGPLEKEIRSRIVQGNLNGAITIHGYADPRTAVSYLKACDALVIPSRLESIPVVYSDGLQCGCPIVAADVGDLGQLIAQQGTGLVCSPEDPEALARAMCTMASIEPGPRQHYAETLLRAYDTFNPSHSAARCSALLAQL